MSSISGTPRGRYAPSPTGDIHLGNARTALVAWLSSRSAGGEFFWRVEDIDRKRTVPGVEERQIEDLRWLGLDWDAGPGAHSLSGNGPDLSELSPFHQSERTQHYLAALQQLESAGKVFPCKLSRKDLREIASAPHGPETMPYPNRLRPRSLPPGWLSRLLNSSQPDASIRFKVQTGRNVRSSAPERPLDLVQFTDLVVGPVHELVGETTGDFVLRRRDREWAYQLAVVVDDAYQGVTEVVRGQDLLSSTPRQILLQRALGYASPRYGHVPMVLNANGDKLSKRNQALTLSSLREAGWSSESVVGQLAFSLALTETARPLTPAALVQHFAWDRVRPEPVSINDNFVNEPRFTNLAANTGL